MAPKKAHQDQIVAPNIRPRHQSSSPSAARDIPGSSPTTSGRTAGRSAKPRRSYRDESGQPTHATDPSAPYDQLQPDDMSRRESTSTMRTSSIPLEGPVTYTPTTHRVSKAKKGKRVHACEFPGCGKVSGMTSVLTNLTVISPPSSSSSCASRHLRHLTVFTGLHQSRAQEKARRESQP
jgi:hypothetical protein